MKKAGPVAILVVVIGLLCVGMYASLQSQSTVINYDLYDLNAVITGNKDNGNIGDHVKGNEEAPVILFEYVDYTCAYCAEINEILNELVAKRPDDLAVVQRTFLLNNDPRVSAAAEAAGLQGYWKPYADLLFEEQNSWARARGDELLEVFATYFDQVSAGEGDLEKFKSDMTSKEVLAKVRFDTGIGAKLEIRGTPALYLDGELINPGANGSTKEAVMGTLEGLIDARI